METINGNKNGHSVNGYRYAFDNFEIEPANRTLLRDGKTVAGRIHEEGQSNFTVVQPDNQTVTVGVNVSSALAATKAIKKHAESMK